MRYTLSQYLPLSLSTKDDLLVFRTLFTFPSTTIAVVTPGPAAVYALTMSLLLSDPFAIALVVVPDVPALT